METIFLCGYAWVGVQSIMAAISHIFKWNERYNRLLILIFMLTAVLAWVHYGFRFTQMLFLYPQYSFIHDVIELAYGPIIYQFAILVVRDRYGKYAAWHFVPLVFYALYFIVFQIGGGQPFKLQDYLMSTAHTTVVYLIMFSFIAYTIATHKVILYAQKSAKGLSFTCSGWLNVLYVFLGLKAAYAVILFTLKTYFTSLWFDGPTLRWLVDVLFFLSCTILLVAQGNLVLFPRLFTFKFSGQLKAFGKGKLFANLDEVLKVIDEREVKACGEAISQLFHNDKLYRDSELTEQHLSEKIGLPKRHITRLLNFYLKTNFNEFVNFHRVSLAREMLLDPAHATATMYAVAMDSGFKSESAFYANFKQFTGLTPKKFRDG